MRLIGNVLLAAMLAQPQQPSNDQYFPSIHYGYQNDGWEGDFQSDNAVAGMTDKFPYGSIDELTGHLITSNPDEVNRYFNAIIVDYEKKLRILESYDGEITFPRLQIHISSPDYDPKTSTGIEYGAFSISNYKEIETTIRKIMDKHKKEDSYHLFKIVIITEIKPRKP